MAATLIRVFALPIWQSQAKGKLSWNLCCLIVAGGSAGSWLLILRGVLFLLGS